VQTPGEIILARVPNNTITTQANYEFVSGFDGLGNPIWTTTVAQ
jgi:hypothetical protein